MERGRARTDGVDLARVATAGDADTDVDILELVQAEDEELERTPACQLSLKNRLLPRLIRPCGYVRTGS